MEIYKDVNRTPKERAKDLLGKMSLEEKMGQIVGAWARRGEEWKLDESCGIGQISTLEFRRGESMEEAAEWQRSLQDRVMAASPHHIPAVFHMEGLCGAFIQDTTAFPSGVNRGASFDPELERQLGEVVSRQEAACGITQILAPVLDISRDSRIPRFPAFRLSASRRWAPTGGSAHRPIPRSRFASRRCRGWKGSITGNGRREWKRTAVRSAKPSSGIRRFGDTPATVAFPMHRGALTCRCVTATSDLRLPGASRR